jgi:hypothetical protein
MTEFITQGPVDPESSLFVGRRAELNRIANWVKVNSCVGCVAGARQTGKTTLLQRACREYGCRYTFVAVDLQAIEGAGVSECLTYIASEIAECVPGASGRTLSEPASSQTFLSFLREVAASTSAVRIAITLDEFGALPDDTAVKLAHTIRAAFTNRNLKVELKRYCFILAGALDLRRIIAGRNSPLKNVTQSIYVPDFTLAEVADLLRAAGFPEPEAYSEDICTWTNGHPYWTQLLASRIADSDGTLRPRGRAETITEELLATEDTNIPHLLHALEDGHALDVLRGLLKGESVVFSRSDPSIAELELIGAVRNENGNCRIRNRIYETALSRALRSGASSPSWPRKSKADVGPMIFVSYARADAAWLGRLQIALKPLFRDTDVCLWRNWFDSAGRSVPLWSLRTELSSRWSQRFQ